MKKSLLVLSILFLSVSFAGISAADLNPFAYDLKSEYNPSTLTLTINFTLNAPASYVKLAISNGQRDVWTKEYLASSYQAGKVPKATYTETIDALALPQGEELTWRVDVKGAAVASPTFVKNDVRLYAPTSVDIDNNPENANFGTVFCVEGLNGAYQTSGYTGYISYEDGAGLYLLNADGTARKMPFQTEKVRYGYNGGVVNQPNRTRPSFGNNGTNDLNGYNAYRVRVSDDGRIFVTAFSTNGQVLWEAKKECFSATSQAEWSANTGWYKVITQDDANTVMATTKRSCSHDYCGVYSLFQGNASTGKFIAGPNLGFDVRGSGKDLKLLMLAGCKQAVVYSTPAHFYCDEYDLGTATLWNTAPSRRIFAGHSNGVDIVNAQGVQVQYDKSDNVWVCQHRATTEGANTTLARVNRASSPTTDDQNHNITGGKFENVEATTIYRRCGAIRFNEDFTQVVIASNAHGAGGGFTVYPVNASTGLPNWNSGTQVDTYSKTGNSLMDFAWDYAGNLYIAADAATNGERIAVYAMPHTADRVVSTPAASKYAFTVNCQEGAKYQVTTICNPPEAGTITCSIGGNARAAGVLNDIPSCTELTVTATPEDGYKFLNWTDGNDNVLSTDKEFTFYVTENITLKANFEYATYTGIVWKNLFYDGEDIVGTKTTYPNSPNERLWRLLQVAFNNYAGDKADQGMVPVTKTKSYEHFKCAPFFSGRASKVKPFFTTQGSFFYWLWTYMKEHKLDENRSNNAWIYYSHFVVNRADSCYNIDNALCNNMANGAYDRGGSDMWTNQSVNWDSFNKYGKPEYWRPYWAEHACNLPQTMKYSDYMPTVVTWKRPDCPSGSIAGVTPSSWYKWNHSSYDASIKDVDYQKYFILAWRANSPTGDTIVHHVYRNNMELHASYVLKNIDENDKVDPTKHDASNDDVIKLMQNRHWVNLSTDPNVHPTHTLTVTRKLQAGEFNTICLPFGVDLEGLQDDNTYHHPLKNADAYEYAGTTTSTYNESGEPVVVLNFNKVTHLEPGKPYLIQMKNRNENLREDMTFSSVSCFTDLHPSQGGGLIFEPTINPTKIPAGSLILVAGNRLALTTQEGVLSGMRGYFRIDESDPILANDIMEQASAGRVYLSFKKPVTSSVPVAPEAEQQLAPKARKIMRDGNIYIIRGDEVYTIGGVRVK